MKKCFRWVNQSVILLMVLFPLGVTGVMSDPMVERQISVPNLVNSVVKKHEMAYDDLLEVVGRVQLEQIFSGKIKPREEQFLTELNQLDKAIRRAEKTEKFLRAFNEHGAQVAEQMKLSPKTTAEFMKNYGVYEPAILLQADFVALEIQRLKLVREQLQIVQQNPEALEFQPGGRVNVTNDTVWYAYQSVTSRLERIEKLEQEVIVGIEEKKKEKGKRRR